jgi:hypothetical protein
VGANGASVALGVANANMFSLSFYDDQSSAIKITNTSVDIWIERTVEATLPPFTLCTSTQSSSTNASNSTSNGNNQQLVNQLVGFGFAITLSNSSVHLNIMPTYFNSTKNATITTAYLIVLKLGGFPVVNSTYQSHDDFQILCPSSRRSRFFLNSLLSLT